MGAFLDHPRTQKTNECGEVKEREQVCRYVTSSMQGWRIDMEDAHRICVSIPEFPEWSFFAVFDGHAGNKVAFYSASHLLETLMETPQFRQLREMSNDGRLAITDEAIDLLKKGLIDGFLNLDAAMQQQQTNANTEEKERSGTTCICALMTPTHIFFSNLGDSRGLLCRKSEIVSTVDHKPYLEKERERIVKAGGSVMIQRVNGSLAVSRAFGDFEYKSVPELEPRDQLVSPEPEVYVIKRNKEEDEFMVLACDGIYDVLENEELYKIICSRLSAKKDLKEATNQVLDVCLSKGSRDNMTMVLVIFESAPKFDEEAEKKEIEWENKMKAIIQDHIEANKKDEMLDAEVLTTVLKDRHEEPNRPGGIHMARTLINEAIDKHASKQQQNDTTEVQQDRQESIESTATSSI
ncbi:protein phosphatase 2C domain-containing protein [Ditylenchus destructor]|nr:protein phosphatase 2C domain-containing protein [Ditylenchus destructor]